MRSLTEEELNNAPIKVQQVYMMLIVNQFVSSSLYRECVDKYPDYFPEEVEHKNKWNSIPQEIHDAYWKEYWELEEQIMKDVPPSKGVTGWINDKEGYNKWYKKWFDAKEKGKPLHEDLHKKYYSKYGIDCNLW